jgi:diguanylate cyclase (GGDEF)-like protein
VVTLITLSPRGNLNGRLPRLPRVPIGQKLRERVETVTQAVVASNNNQNGGSSTHYVACWFQDNCHLRCWHQHRSVSEAAGCLDAAGGFVRAVTDGRERLLTYDEQENLVRACLALYLAEKERSRKDSKTGALNDRAFNEVLNHEIRRSRRNGRPLTIVYIDLDGFKAVNDSLGHRTGDLVLQVTVWTMQSAVREMDVVARLGGDEFVLLLPETSADNAQVVMDKVQKALKDTLKAYKWSVTFSAGMVTFRTPPATPDYMIDIAERAVNSVKRTGKNRISRLVLD